MGKQDHLGLIEINTNAGGAMLNAVRARAKRICCAAVDGMVPTRADVAAFEQRIVDMFRSEWQRSRLATSARPLNRIAIVDLDPEAQYFYPEFLAFQQLFERHGLRAVIADPAAHAGRRLRSGLQHGRCVGPQRADLHGRQRQRRQGRGACLLCVFTG